MVKIVRFADAERYEPQEGWARVSLCAEKEVSIEYFVKPPRHASPRHTHENIQVLYVVRGKLLIEDGRGDKYEVEEGDCAYIPGGEPHIVTNQLDEPSVGLDIFVPGRSFDFWLKRREGESP